MIVSGYGTNATLHRVLLHLIFNFLPSSLAMVIGFRDRNQTVSESDSGSGSDLFQLEIVVECLRKSEREYQVLFNLQLEGCTFPLPESNIATVEAITLQFSSVYDALFGSRDNPGDPIQDERILRVGGFFLSPLTTLIRNDFLPEETECFSILITSPDVPGFRTNFECNTDESGATDFYCLHTICIEDDDGRLY